MFEPRHGLFFVKFHARIKLQTGRVKVQLPLAARLAVTVLQFKMAGTVVGNLRWLSLWWVV